MSSKKRPRVCTYNGAATDEPHPLPIPFDLRLDVLSRLDGASLLRYAAASKSTRRDILSEDFRRSVVLPEASRDFDPALLLGFSYRLSELAATAGDRVAQTTCRQHPLIRFDANLLDSFDAVAWRDGLVVLLRRRQHWTDAPLPRADPDLRICNSLTGQVSRLPPADVHEAYPHALLAVGGAGCSFRLLAVDSDLRKQTFSSEDGRWGAVVEPRHTAHLPHTPPGCASRATVVGPTVYWLCILKRVPGQPPPPNPPWIVSLDAGTSQASRIELPPACLNRLRFSQNVFHALMLAPLPGRSLSVLAAEICVISMWTLSGAPEGDSSTLPPAAVAARWTRQVVIRRHVIEHQPGPDYSVKFMGLGERSGTVVLQMDGIGLVQLNLGSREAAVVRSDESFKRRFGFYNRGHYGLCLHEIHLTDLLQLQDMKPF